MIDCRMLGEIRPSGKAARTVWVGPNSDATLVQLDDWLACIASDFSETLQKPTVAQDGQCCAIRKPHLNFTRMAGTAAFNGIPECVKVPTKDAGTVRLDDIQVALPKFCFRRDAGTVHSEACLHRFDPPRREQCTNRAKISSDCYWATTSLISRAEANGSSRATLPLATSGRAPRTRGPIKTLAVATFAANHTLYPALPRSALRQASPFQPDAHCGGHELIDPRPVAATKVAKVEWPSIGIGIKRQF